MDNSLSLTASLLAQPLPAQLILLTAPQDIEAVQARCPARVAVLGLEAVEARRLVLRDTAGQLTHAASVPALCVGLVAASMQGWAHLDGLAPCLARFGGDLLPPPGLLAAEGGALDMLLAGGVVDVMARAAAHTVRLSREMAGLRSTYEHVQNAFAQLESFVNATGLQKIRLAFESAPDAPHALGGPGIRQLLPVNILGLSAVELHVAGPAEAGFAAVLRTLEDGAEHGRWVFETPPQPGWLVLPLVHGVVGLQRTPELELHPLDGQLLPPFSLGTAQPFAAFRAVVPPGGETPVRSLALRAWSGLPGVRPPNLSETTPPAPAQGPRSHELMLPFSVTRHVRRILPEWRADFEVVELRPEQHGFLCHPGPGGIPTMVALDSIDLSEPSSISALANVPRAEAAPIEFGIAFSRLPDEHVKLLMEEGFLGAAGSDFVFTGWRRGTHGTPVQLNLPVSGSIGRLVFATRMANKGPEWFAWATFTGLRQTFLGRADEARRWDAAAAETPAPEEIPAAAPVPPPEQTAPPAPPPLVAADPVLRWLSGMQKDIFDPATMTVHCEPPVSGIALRRLPALEVTSGFLFEATPYIGNPDAPALEFGIALSDLSPGGVLVQLAGNRQLSDDGRCVFSGWQRIAPGEAPRLSISAEHLGVPRACVFLVTRFVQKQRASIKTRAHFSDLWANLPTGEQG